MSASWQPLKPRFEFGLLHKFFYCWEKPSTYHTLQLQFHDVIVGPVIYGLQVTDSYEENAFNVMHSLI